MIKVDFSELGQFQRWVEKMSPVDQRALANQYQSWLQDPGIGSVFQRRYQRRLAVLKKFLGESGG